MAKRAANAPAEVDKALLAAAANGRVHVVKYLIGQGAQIDTCDEEENTPLYIATANGHLDVVEYLVDHRAQVERGDNKSNTPLHVASFLGHLDIVQYLIGQKANIDKLNIRGKTPLYLASYKGHLNVVQHLVGQGAQVEMVDIAGDTPLLVASGNGHLDVVQYLVGQKANIEHANHRDKTPIYGASFYGHLDVVRYLVGQGAQVERGDHHGDTPLLVASRNGHLDVVQYLNSEQAQRKAASFEGSTSVSEAPSEASTTMAPTNLNVNTNDIVNQEEAAGDKVPDARLSFPQPEVHLKKIVMADLTVRDSSGGQFPFHEKKAREHEGCHLGGGSFGEVFKAKHAVHGDVAVKLAKYGERGQMVMYQKEAQKHENSLICEHIVPIKGFVQCEDDACNCGLIGIVMTYMENGSLWNFRISKWQHHPDLWPLTNRMVYQISCGMHFLHSNDIIHRDLKLENVLVDGNLNVKIADLGLATNLQTSFGDRCWGTHSHKPPEAFREDLPESTKVVTPKYDVYSFAMTLYELLTGIHPYSDREFKIVKKRKVNNQPPCLQPVPVDTPKALIDVMTDSWRYEANDRPNFGEILGRVKKLDTEPTHESLGLYLGDQRSPKEEVIRGMEDLTVHDQAPAKYQSNTITPVQDTQPVIDNESVRRRMEDSTVYDHTPVQQSNINTAIPITETVTQKSGGRSYAEKEMNEHIKNLSEELGINHFDLFCEAVGFDLEHGKNLLDLNKFDYSVTYKELLSQWKLGKTLKDMNDLYKLLEKSGIKLKSKYKNSAQN